MPATLVSMAPVVSLQRACISRSCSSQSHICGIKEHKNRNYTAFSGGHERISATADARQAAAATPRRDLLLASWALLLAGQASAAPHGKAAESAAVAPATPLPLATIRPELAPDQALYDAADPRLREAGGLVQQALGAASIQEEERLWTEVIERFSSAEAAWAPDLLARAWGNRGNCRSRQGRLGEALSDLNHSIQLAPWSPDPVLNRGVVLEAMGRFQEAAADYRAVLAAVPEDPAAWCAIRCWIGCWLPS